MNLVINPSSLETKVKERAKTDKIDSKKMAMQLYHGRLKGIYVPSRERETYRELTRLRDVLVKEKTSFSRRMKMFLYRQGLIAHDDRRMVTERWMAEMLSFINCPNLSKCFQEYVTVWIELDHRKKAIEKGMAIQAEEDCFLQDIYMSAPGIGPISARTLANELGDLSQFSSQKKLYSYLGLTPTEYSSGEQQRLGHITRQGRAMLRGVLVEAAWRAIKLDLDLKDAFDRIAKTQGKKRAIVAIARKLIGRIRACFNTQSLYGCKEEEEEVSVGAI
jgi:transposase